MRHERQEQHTTRRRGDLRPVGLAIAAVIAAALAAAGPAAGERVRRRQLPRLRQRGTAGRRRQLRLAADRVEPGRRRLEVRDRLQRRDNGRQHRLGVRPPGGGGRRVHVVGAAGHGDPGVRAVLGGGGTVLRCGAQRCLGQALRPARGPLLERALELHRVRLGLGCVHRGEPGRRGLDSRQVDQDLGRLFRAAGRCVREGQRRQRPGVATRLPHADRARGSARAAAERDRRQPEGQRDAARDREPGGERVRSRERDLARDRQRRRRRPVRPAAGRQSRALRQVRPAGAPAAVDLRAAVRAVAGRRVTSRSTRRRSPRASTRSR